jgi:hypothetical protein
VKANRKEGLIDVFKNAVRARTLNKRITIAKVEKDSNEISFIRMTEKDEKQDSKTSVSFCVKNKVRVTKIMLSDEGIGNLYQALKQYVEHVKK